MRNAADVTSYQKDPPNLNALFAEMKGGVCVGITARNLNPNLG